MIEVNWKPDRSQLRVFGTAGVLVFAGVGALVYFRRSIVGFELEAGTANVVAGALWGLSAFCLAGIAALPRMLLPLYLGLSAVTWPIGFVVSWIVMSVIYYGVLTPIALVFKLRGRDLMHRRFDADATTYWVRRPAPPDVKRYFRQF